MRRRGRSSSGKTVILIAAALGVAGLTLWWWRRGKGAAPSLSTTRSMPLLSPPAPATAAQIAAGAYQDETGWHIPAAVRTPEQQSSAIAAEIRANTGVRRF
jgi:hypothetical protein